MSPRQHFHKRAPKPQLLKLGLPLSLPTPVTQLLDPLVQVAPPSSESSSQPPQQNPPAPQPSPQPAPQPSPQPAPQPSPRPSSSHPSSPSSGGHSNSGGNGSGGSSSNDGNQSSNNGSDETNGTQGNQNGGNSGGSDNGGQSNSPNGSNQSSQNGTPTSTGSSNTPANGTGQSQSPPSQPNSGNSGNADGGSPSSGAENGKATSQVGGSEGTVSPVPILGDISSPSQSGGPSSQNGNINSDTHNDSDTNSPSQTGQSSTSPDSGSTSNNPFGVTGNHDNGAPLSSSPNSTASSSIPSASTLAVASKSHSGEIATGITVSLAALAIIAFIIFFLRRRHQRRQAERRVTWITGFVNGEVPDMTERSSIRSSWGTPNERLTSWARPSNEDPFAHDPSAALPPVLPLPVHSPLVIERPGFESPEIPENPFSDVEAAIQASPQPLQPMLTLPIRLSLISAGSGQDPFDDTHRTNEPIIDSENNPSYKLSEGHNPATGYGPSQANFPMPPSTPSVKSVFAVGSPSDLHPSKELLQTPTISFTFPDSPVSPTFASSGTTSYPRRVSVKYDFRASQARSDEIHLEKGEEVNVMSVYEDGWAFVQKEKDNERGLAPLHCLDLAE